MEVTDPNLIKQLDKLRLKGFVDSDKEITGDEVTDPDLIKALDKERLGKTLKGRISNAAGVVYDFFQELKKQNFRSS